MRIRLLATLLAVCLAGCTVGPDYQRPTVVSPDARRMDYPKATDVANTKWWEQFGDPVLNELVETALRENLDIQIAAARVDQFIGALTSTRSQLFPQIGYGADASRIRASAVGQPPLPPGADPYFSLYQGSLGASWQLDLFGRVRRLTEAAQAQVYASEQAQHGVVLSLVTSIATSYILLRALDRQLQIAQYTANNFTATARLFELRFKSGIVAKTEVMQIRSQQQQALAAIPAFEQAIASQENLISILLGRNPGPIARGKTVAAPARHPAGRTKPGGRQCQYRCRTRAVLPKYLPDRLARHRQHGLQQPALGSGKHKPARGGHHRPDLHVRRDRGSGRLSRGTNPAGAARLPADDPRGLSRNQRRTDRIAKEDQ